MSDTKKIEPLSLNAIAALYPMAVATLKDMIRIENPELHKRIAAFIEKKKRLMPPSIIAEIFITIGNP